jgi:raffinose/stachyose/melibiose transport system substrate-binding protein
MNFPPVEGGQGDPGNTVGNPGQYLSISSEASDEAKEVAREFFATEVLSDEEVSEWINDAGSVPIVNGIEGQLDSSDNAEFLTFIYDIASNAESFQQSWDQALSPTAAEALLDNIAQLFQLSITPEEFASNMNEVIGT